MAFRFRTAFRKLVPGWLQAPEGSVIDRSEVLYSLGLMKDAFVERVRQGTMARFPSHAPPSALPYIGRDRRIVRGIDEPEAAYRERLIRWLDDHRTRGNPWSLMAQLRAFCQVEVRIRTVDASGNWYTLERDGSLDYRIAGANWDWDGLPANPNWSRFWVIIYPTVQDVEPWAINFPWGDPELWETSPSATDGGVWGNPGMTIGTTATSAEVAGVKSIISEWMPHGTTCEWIIIAFDDASFDPADPAQPSPNPGEWGNWGRYDGSGNYVSARLETARYWRGPQRPG